MGLSFESSFIILLLDFCYLRMLEGAWGVAVSRSGAHRASRGLFGIALKRASAEFKRRYHFREMHKLVLFDIDGTLLNSGKAPRQAIGKALEIVFGSRGALDGWRLAGKTDRQIIYEVMTEAGFDGETVMARMGEVAGSYVRIIREGLKPEDIRLMPGVLPLLGELRSAQGAVLGLLTGNLQESARIKLANANLLNFFMQDGELLGGFGSDAIQRREVAEIAIERAQLATGFPYREKEIVVVGDSIHDVQCARHLNVKTIAVATGGSSMEELLEEQPDYVFQDFTDYREAAQSILR